MVVVEAAAAGRPRLLRGLAARREGGRRTMVFFLLQSVSGWSSLARFCRLPLARPSTRPPPASMPAYALTHTFIPQVFFTYYSS